MRLLLVSDPFLPTETKEAIASRDDTAHDLLVAEGVDDCEAAELLDEPRCG